MTEDQPTLGDAIRVLRERKGLSRAQLAQRSGFSVETLRSFENGRRTPDRAGLVKLAGALEVEGQERTQLFTAAGDDTESVPLLMHPIRDRRARVEGTEDELARYNWTTLFVNERHEVRGWNELANAVAEADLAELVPNPPDRNLLWLASLEHIEQRLANWKEIIGRLVTIFRIEGVTLDRGAPPPPYLQALINRLAAVRPDMLSRFYNLWLAPETWHQGQRNLHPVEWRLADGTELSFIGGFREWSLFDGSFMFDWVPANPATSAWMEAALVRVGRAGYAPGITSAQKETFAEMLAAARDEVGMSASDLQHRSGVSANSIYSYERGRRRPRPDTVLKLARGLALDGFTTNDRLESLGYPPEPSDLARALCGLPAHGIRAGYSPDPSIPERERMSELMASPWPNFMVNGVCEVEAANSPGGRLVDLPAITRDNGGGPLHLVEFMASPRCRERMLNWPEVARAVVPKDLRPIVLGYRDQKPATALGQRLRAIGRRNREAVEALLDAWESAPDGPSPRRVAVPIEWVGDNGDTLHFHCFVYGWNGYDPYWSVDWNPANQAAWDAVARISGSDR